MIIIINQDWILTFKLIPFQKFADFILENSQIKLKLTKRNKKTYENETNCFEY